MGPFHAADLWYVFRTLHRCWRPWEKEDFWLAYACNTYALAGGVADKAGHMAVISGAGHVVQAVGQDPAVLDGRAGQARDELCGGGEGFAAYSREHFTLHCRAAAEGWALLERQFL